MARFTPKSAQPAGCCAFLPGLACPAWARIAQSRHLWLSEAGPHTRRFCFFLFFHLLLLLLLLPPSGCRHHCLWSAFRSCGAHPFEHLSPCASPIKGPVGRNNDSDPHMSNCASALRAWAPSKQRRPRRVCPSLLPCSATNPCSSRLTRVLESSGVRVLQCTMPAPNKHWPPPIHHGTDTRRPVEKLPLRVRGSSGIRR